MIQSPSQVAPAKNAAAVDPAMRKAAQGFEAVFLREIIGSMRKAKLCDDPLSSSATENFRELADARTAETMATSGSLGIAALVERQFANHHIAKSGESK
jgi:peptidoglycan hydrolase FlgJ